MFRYAEPNWSPEIHAFREKLYADEESYCFDQGWDDEKLRTFIEDQGVNRRELVAYYIVQVKSDFLLNLLPLWSDFEVEDWEQVMVILAHNGQDAYQFNWWSRGILGIDTYQLLKKLVTEERIPQALLEQYRSHFITPANSRVGLRHQFDDKRKFDLTDLEKIREKYKEVYPMEWYMRAKYGLLHKKMGIFRKYFRLPVDEIEHAYTARKPYPDLVQLLTYLKAGHPLNDSSEVLYSLLPPTEEISGTLTLRTDGEYCWADEYAHYVAHHQLLVPSEFRNHIIEKQYEIPPLSEAEIAAYFEKYVTVPDYPVK